MAVIQSGGSVLEVRQPWYPSTTPSVGMALYEGVYHDYAAIWRTQPNVRTVVGFLARNVAQLGLHIYDRVSDGDRRRVTDGLAGTWLRKPTASPKVSVYDLINWFVHDLCVFDDAYWLKMLVPETDTTAARVATVPALPQFIEPRGGNLLDPDTYRLHGPRGFRDFEPDEVVHVHGYNPEDRRHGVSPMETLRRIIAEDVASGRYRERFWRNATRIEGVLQRPEGKKALSDIARERLKADWQAAYGQNGTEAGGTPLLEEGMTFEQTSFSAKDSEYIAARKLTREEVAAAFWVHPAMVGIMEHANFANMREQHRSTYQDTLGPIMVQLAQAFGLQLGSDLGLPDTAYFEFNIKEKLRGSFEEEAQSLQAAVGAPHMTRNEARARQNLPAIDGGDLLVTPLNVLIGGQASARDGVTAGGGGGSLPETSGTSGFTPDEIAKLIGAAATLIRSGFAPEAALAAVGLDPVQHLGLLPVTVQKPQAVENPDEELEEALKAAAMDLWSRMVRTVKALGAEAAESERLHEQVFLRFYRRQQAVVLSALGGEKARGVKASLAEVFDRERWDIELAADLLTAALSTAQASGDAVVVVLGGTWDVTEVEGLGEALRESAEGMATEVNDWTAEHLESALAADDPVEETQSLFSGLIEVRAAMYAASRTNSVWNFGRGVAARSSGASHKRWRVTSSNPRRAHARLNGETVEIGEPFSNGQSWPGDPAGDAASNANCRCTFDVLTEEP